MKAQDFRKKIIEMSDEELVAKERDLREDFFKLKFQHGVRQIENTGKLHEIRKNIARVKTVMSSRQQ